MSCKRWEAREGRHHSQVLCPWGLWLRPRTCPGGVHPPRLPANCRPVGRPRAPPRQGRRKEEAWVRCLQETEAKPAAASVCSESQAGISSGEDARLCGPCASGLLAFFWRLYFFVVVKSFFFFFFYKLHPSISSNKEFVHTLDQALVPFRKLVISSSKCSVPWMDAGLDF